MRYAATNPIFTDKNTYEGWKWWVGLLAICALLVTPLFLLEVPPILDYPAHMARMRILADSGNDPILSKIFEIKWSLIPNILLDVLVPPLLSVVSWDIAGKIILALTLILTPISCAVCARACFGRAGWWPLMAGLISYNGSFILGFLNFDISISLCLLTAAAWIRYEPTKRLAIIPLFTLASIMLLLGHVMAFLFFTLLIGCHEGVDYIGEFRKDSSISRTTMLRMVYTALVVVPSFLLYLNSNFAGTSTGIAWPSYDMVAYMAFAPFITYNPIFDALTGFTVLLFVLGCIREKKFSLYMPSVIACGALLVMYCFAPIGLKGGWFFSLRFPIMAASLAFCTFKPKGIAPRLEKFICVAFGTLLFARIGFLATLWLGVAGDYESIKKVIASVPPSARVMVVLAQPTEGSDYYKRGPRARYIAMMVPTHLHLPDMALLERHAFWQTPFTILGQQPVLLKMPYAANANPGGPLPTPDMLACGSAVNEVYYPYIRNWQTRFDYVLLLDPSALSKPFQSKYLRPVEIGSFAALYKVSDNSLNCGP